MRRNNKNEFEVFARERLGDYTDMPTSEIIKLLKNAKNEFLNERIFDQENPGQ